MSKDAYIKSLEVFMQKVAEKVKCLPDYTDPANENNHILRAIDQLLETAHNSGYKQCGHNEKFIGIKSDTNKLFCVKCNSVIG